MPFIDELNRRIGRFAAWALALMVLAAALVTLGAKVGAAFGTPIRFVALDEAQWYLFSALFLLTAPWALRESAHVRVDVLYGRLGARGRAAIDLVGSVFLLLPFALYAIAVTVPTALESIRVGEMSNDAGGLPRYPLWALVPIAFGLLALQALSEAVHAAGTLFRGHSSEERDAPR